MNWEINLKKKVNVLICLYVCVFYLHVCLCTTRVPGTRWRLKGCWIPRNWSYMVLSLCVGTGGYGSRTQLTLSLEAGFSTEKWGSPFR